MTDQPNPNPTSNTPHEDASKTPLTAFLEHQVTAAQETIKALEALIPPDFRKHSHAARHEFLLSFKVLLDGAMTSVERELNKARSNNTDGDNSAGGTGGTTSGGASTTGKTKVKVEVS